MSSRIPQTFIDDLLGRVDLVDVIGASVQLRKAGQNFQGLCPFHHEKTPSFTVSPEKQFYHCFGCGANGTAISFLMNFNRMEFREALEELAHRVGLTVPETGTTVANPSLEPLYSVLKQAAHYYTTQLRQHPEAERAVDYLKRRGVTGEMAKSFGLGYAPPGWDNLLRTLATSPEQTQAMQQAGLLVTSDRGGHYDRFRDRIMFPILDRKGQVIGFGGRVLGSEEPKYLNSPETPVFQKGRELYGLYYARKHEQTRQRLLIVEGYMDVLALVQHGVHNVVATLGTATTAEHLERAFRLTAEVVFCFDGDRAGKKAAWRAMEVALPLLQGNRSVGFLFLPEGEDPDTLVRKQGVESFANSHHIVSLSSVLFNTLTEQVDLHTLEGRARLVELAKPYLTKLTNPLLRQMMLNRLAELTQLGETHLTRLAGVTNAATRGRDRTRKPVVPDATPEKIRRPLTMLLQWPALALETPKVEDLANLPYANIGLLIELITHIQEYPAVSCAALLESWRERDEYTYLCELASKEILLSENALKNEFLAAITKLLNESRKLQEDDERRRRWEARGLGK